MALFLAIISVIIAVTINVLTSCYVCYNVAVDDQPHTTTIATVTAVVLINALVPYMLGCITGLWYIT